LVFGGEQQYNESRKRRDLLNDLWIYSASKAKWEALDRGDLNIEARKFHASCLVGFHLVIHGGITYRNVFLDNILCYSLSKFKSPAT
jgi:hypothetical protein